MEQPKLDFLTSEPLVGELLADRLASGPLAADQVLRYSVDIGVALHEAHRNHVVHGHICPYCVVIVDDHARLLQPPQFANAQMAPYCSPEQVRGEPLDTRTDVFSFGAVLYEMAAGKRAFTECGEGLHREILEKPPAALNGKSPVYPALENVLAGCLAKSLGARRQRIQNAVIELKLAAGTLRATTPGAGKGSAQAARSRRSSSSAAPGPDTTPADGRGKRFSVSPERRAFYGWLPWRVTSTGVALVLLLAVTALWAAAWLHKDPVSPVYTFKVAPPENASYLGPPAVSPDGRYLTFSAVGPEGQRVLWLRPLDSERSTPIAGTEGGIAPFWSPDSRQIGFFAAKTLRRVPISGGTAETISAADMRAGGGTWSDDGTILFAPGLTDGLYQVPAAGGKAEPLLKLDPSQSQHSFLWPQFLPDNRHFLFYANTDSHETTGVYVGTLSPLSYRLLFPSETNAIYSTLADSESRKKGYLLFIHDRTLMGQRFNTADLSLISDPIPLRDDIGALTSLALAPISVSTNAVLVYQTVGRPTRQMVWMDREGKQIAAVKEPGEWGPPRISPDGTEAVVVKAGPDGKNDLWLIGGNGAATQFTNTPLHEGSPVWSPDGTRVAYFIQGREEENFDICSKPVSGDKPELLFRGDSAKYPTDWSKDGKLLLFTTFAPGAKSDVWGLNLSDRSPGERRAGPILDTIHAEGNAVLSPDARWLAYQSDETGRNEVYIQAFDGIVDGVKRRWMVSAAGGGWPRWREDGKELFFLTESGSVMAVPLHPSAGEFEFDPPRVLFQTQPIPKIGNLYDVSPDGQRFLVNLPLELSNTSSIVVVTSWTEKLKD